MSVAAAARAQRPVRVLLLCESLGVTGGVERFVCDLGNALAARGMAVTLGNVDTRREHVAYTIRGDVAVLSADRSLPDDDPPPGVGRGVSMLRTRWRVGRALGALIDAARPDVVVLNGLVTACSVLLLNRRISARTICCDHNHFEARSRLWQHLRALLYPRVAAVVSLSRADVPKFSALNRNTHVIPNASSLRADAPASPESLRVLAVGRHAAQKGFDLLLRAWRDVAVALPEARLTIVGSGPLGDELSRLAKELGVNASVEWHAPTPDIERLYRESALFVLSSRYEGMPLALLEAQALGVPAVAFDCPTGPREIVSDETGIVVTAGDTAALGSAIVALLGDPERRARMGVAAIVRSREWFSPERQIDAWDGLIGSVAAAAH